MNFVGKFPARRPRRMRRDEFSRRLMRESALSSADFIYPVFVLDGNKREEAVPSMPGVSRKSVDLLFRDAEHCVELGIPAMALFPVIDAARKSLDATAAWDPKGLVPTAIRALKARFPALGIMTDVALDPYTSHGQDGLLDESGYVANDPTVAALTPQSGLGVDQHHRRDGEKDERESDQRPCNALKSGAPFVGDRRRCGRRDRHMFDPGR